MDNDSKVVRAVTSVTFVLLISKVLALLRNILQAQAFGAGADMDLFTLANNYTVSLYTTVAYALCVAAVPVFSRRLTKSRESAFEAANKLISLVVLGSVVLCGLFLILNVTGAAQYLVGAGNEPLFRRCFGWLVLSLPIIAATYLMVALFQSMEHYSLQGSLSLLYSLVLCALLVFVGDKLELGTFAIITAAGWLLQLVMVIPVARKEQFRFRPTLRFSMPELSGFFRTGAVTIVTTAVFLLCYLINSRFAAAMSDGTVSAYYYADKIFEPLTTTLIYSISIVMFPRFNQKYEQMEKQEYCTYVSYVLKNTTLLMFPISLLFAVFGTPIIKVLFEGGSFDASATALTGGVFSVYALGTTGFFILDFLGKAYFAMGKTRVPFVTTLLVLAGCLVSNGLCAVLLPGQAMLLAGGTSLALLLGGCGMYIHFCRTQNAHLPAGRLVIGVVISLLVAGAVYAGYTQFVSLSAGKLELVLRCGLLGVAGFLVYLLLMGRMLPTAEILRKIFGRQSK